MNDLVNAHRVDGEDEEIHTVTCVSCKKTFDGFAPEQANDCAADISNTGVVGYYGSCVADMTQLTFPNGKPEDLGNGQICDACITDLKERGTLVEAGTNAAEFDTAIIELFNLGKLRLISEPKDLEGDTLEMDDGA